MNQPLLGQVIKNVSVQDRDIHGRWLLGTSFNDVTVILDQTLPNITRDMVIGEVVAIRVTNRMVKVKVKDYENELLNQYYDSKDPGKYAAIIQQWHEWLWDAWKNNKISDFTVLRERRSSKGANELCLVKTDDYVLPFWKSKASEFLEPPISFYPGIALRKHEEICLSNTDGKDDFPKKYTATMTGAVFGVNPAMQKKEVEINLYSFGDPHKWHYGIWKHVLALTPSAREHKTMENKFWRKAPCLTSIQSNQFGEYFRHCKENKSQTNCDRSHCIRENIFKQVHGNLKPLTSEYLNEIVTSLDSSATNETKADIRISRLKNGSNIKSIRVTKKTFVADIYTYIILKGYCFNWETAKPVFHVHPVTCYKSKQEIKGVGIGSDNDEIIECAMKLTDVKMISIQ